MKKRILTFMTALCMTLSMIGTAALAAPYDDEYFGIGEYEPTYEPEHEHVGEPFIDPSLPAGEPFIDPSLPAGEPFIDPTVPAGEPFIDPSLPAGEPFIDPSLPAGEPFIDSAAPAIGPSIPASGIAHPSTQIVDIDGYSVTFEMYALLDADGNPTNYIKVRDLAFALNSKPAQFEVDWNGAVNLLSGMPYTANGSENNTPFSNEREYTLPETLTFVNGEATDLTAIFLTDDNGGGYTYYQLRDLGKKLGFNVGWSSERGIFVETDKPYQEQ